ncbi:MAG: MATE family efflux transporter, partial [Rhabdochlamydiaceae bacterium]
MNRIKIKALEAEGHMTEPSNQIFNSSSLTKYPIGSLRELIVLSIPIILTLICTHLTSFCDRIFLARYSLTAFEGCVSASFLCLLFQVACIRLVSIAQVFVGQQKGQGASFEVGTYVWQMVWFSFFSLAITLPVGLLMAPLYFAGTSVQDSGMMYFEGMMYANFLFPLGAALSSFFIGLGKTRFIVCAVLISQGVHLLLDFLLIFGIHGLLPPLGVQGAIIATIFSQVLFCFILLSVFLRRSNREEYGTGSYRLKWDLLYQSLKIGLPSALGKLSVLCAWAATAKIMVAKGEAYLSVLTIGSSFALFFLFINEGIGKAITTIASYLIGAKKWDSLSWKLTQSTLKFLGILSLILFGPFILFPKTTLLFFFPSLPLGEQLQLLILSLGWIWIYAFTNGISFIGVGLLTATQQTFFYMVICNLSWITYFIIFYGTNHFHWPADRLWLV